MRNNRKEKRKAKNGFTYPNYVTLIRGGQDFFRQVIAHIDKAESVVHYQTYIFGDDITGRQVGQALMKAAKRGVRVYLIVDGYASQKLDKQFISELEAAGVHFKFFEPVFRSKNFYFGRRLHHKVITIDDRYSLVGGMNTADRYNDIDDKKAWLDFAVLTEGVVSQELSVLCRKTWNGFIQPKTIEEPIQQNFDTDPSSACLVRMRRNDWVRSKNQISTSYLRMLQGAKDEVIILCSYFIPGRSIRRSLVRAIRRGVRIDVIMTGMSDVKVAKNAERFMYAWLIRHNINIYEYTKNILHGKVAVADKTFTTIGSYNINDISAFASVELNLDIDNEKFSSHVHSTLQQIMVNDCEHLNDERKPFRMNYFQMFIAWASYVFVRLMFYLFTFYFRQEKPSKAR